MNPHQRKPYQKPKQSARGGFGNMFISLSISRGSFKCMLWLLRGAWGTGTGGQDARLAKIGKKDIHEQSRGCKTLVHHICHLSVERLNVSLSDCQSVSCPGGGVCLLSKLLQKLLASQRSSKKLGAVSSLCLTLLAPFCMSGQDISGAPPGWSRRCTFHQFQFWSLAGSSFH